jgi:NAD(P)-dependent dehydrogenase (short-subunit alcohol dehydrogenase family)
MKKLIVHDLIDMTGRCCLITGAAGSLGKTIANTLSELNCDLILVDRDDIKLSKLSNELSAIATSSVYTITCDLESEYERLELIERVKALGRLDVLVNNAAFVGSDELPGWATSFESQSLATWRRALEVNLSACFHLSQAFSGMLSQSGKGSIINIASIYAELGPDWSLYEDNNLFNPAAYSVSKGGLLQLTRWLATTLAPKLRVNAISPGGIERGQPQKFISKYSSRTPMRRMASEEDFRGVITFLASDMSAYVTAQNIRVDGGWSGW